MWFGELVEFGCGCVDESIEPLVVGVCVLSGVGGVDVSIQPTNVVCFLIFLCPVTYFLFLI
jgi:hypothetical protein